jgi:hypothetical protein
MEESLENWSMNKPILIIVYKFPPMGGVGSRRWVKFSKYLVRSGYKVHILTVDYKFKNDIVTWSSDVEKSILIHKFKSKYPLWLLSESGSLFLKKIKRYSNFFLRKLFFYLDIAQLDSKPIVQQAKYIIKKYEIENVIASGHPVSINYIATYLKIDLPRINLIQDYRDNWNDLNVYRYAEKNGINSFARKEKSAIREFLTLFYADKVINVSADLTNTLQNKHSSLGGKFVTITNGYDNDDYVEITSSNDSFNIIYAGSLFNERIEAIYLILDAIISLNDDYINKNLKIIVYSNFNSKEIDKKYRKLLGKNIFFEEFISPDRVIREISKASFCLSINSKFSSYAFGTKIFDYMALSKKIIHISNGAILSDILRGKGQFVCDYQLENMRSSLIDIKNNFINQDAKNIVEYNEFSLEQITAELENLFI